MRRSVISCENANMLLHSVKPNIHICKMDKITCLVLQSPDYDSAQRKSKLLCLACKNRENVKIIQIKITDLEQLFLTKISFSDHRCHKTRKIIIMVLPLVWRHTYYLVAPKLHHYVLLRANSTSIKGLPSDRGNGNGLEVGRPGFKFFDFFLKTVN